jgi:SAM-dependent methyltransferase
VSYRDFVKDRWNSLAREFGDNKPLRAVISRDSDQVNYYFDQITKRILDRSLWLQNKRVLDLGCGIGRLTLWMARKAQHVTAMDISEEMIGVVRNAAASQRLHNTTVLVYDGTMLPYVDASFDVIVCVGVLKYVIDEEDFCRVIGEMCRTVTRGGQIAVIDEFDYDGPVKLSEEDLGGLSVLRCPTDYISLFQKHGMELIEQCSIFRNRFRDRLTRLPFGRFFAARPLVARVMAAVDVRIDEVLRHRVKPMRGFQLLSFVRRS